MELSSEFSVEKQQTTGTLSPVADKNRIQVMDLLRGFALIGIIFMNIEWFNRPISALIDFDLHQAGGDWAASWLVKVFIEGKFYKLFSLLFGMGFAVMLVNAQQAGRPFGAWFTRRMIALFLFGMAHMIFLWGGDILHDYAVAGMFLLGFVMLLNTKRFEKYNQPKTFAKVGFVLILTPLVVSLCVAMFFGATRSNDVITTEWQQRIEVLDTTETQLAEYKTSQEFLDISFRDEITETEAIDLSDETLVTENVSTDEVVTTDEEDTELKEEDMSPEELIASRVEDRLERKKTQAIELKKESQIFTEATYWETTKYRFHSMLDSLGNTPGMAFFVCMPLFMIGYWLVASERLKKPEEHSTFFNALCWGGLGFGLMLNIACVMIMLHPAAKQAREIQIVSNNLFFYGQYILCFGYIGMFVKLASKAWFLKLFSWLAPLGKMALTNYISHSVILSSIFYGYAGGMFGQIGRTEQIALAIVILFLQVLFCQFWLKHFRFGPLEWLWRSITYLKWQPFTIEKSLQSA